MTVKISIYDHVFETSEPEIVTCNSVAEWMLDNKKRLVNFAVFNGQPSNETDITRDVNALMSESGEYIVLITPAAPVLFFIATSWIAIATVITIAAAGYALYQLSNLKTPSAANRTQQSANNALASRTNEPRVLQRIEDIYGQVRSYPSLLQPVYSKYINNTQYEYSYMCIGRGWYEIDDVRDGDSLVSDVPGASAEFYNPFTSPNSGSPFLKIGGGISEPVRLVKKSNNVDGQTLQARNQFTIITNTDFIDFYKASASPVTVGDKIGGMSNELYDNLTIGGDLIVTGSTGYDGTYTIANKLGLGTNVIELTTATFSSTATSIATLTSTTSEPEYTSWVTLKDADMTQVWINIVAQQGLFYENNDGKLTLTVNFDIEYQELIAGTYVPTGSIYTHSDTISGVDSNLKGKTIEITTGWTGATRVRVRRTSNHDFSFEGSVVDEIKYESLSAVSELSVSNFGNVTTAQTLTKATTRALALKERKFNLKAMRKLPLVGNDYVTASGAFNPDGSIASGVIYGTRRFIDIIAAITQDPYIGKQPLTALDMPQIYSVWRDIRGDYFAPTYSFFDYTLDNDNTSYEETVRLIANAVFCIAYRQNSKIRFTFDKPQTASTALFTHRNKKPSSDVISRRFTADAEYDGIELTFNYNVSDAQEVIKLPLSGLATNYKKIELTGVREYEVAYIRAAREYNKLQYQRVSIETETTTDGRLLLPNQRIDIVDNTRFDSQDGEVIAQSGLTLTLSRNLVFGIGTHSILLMRRDGSLESVGCTVGTQSNKVVLDYAPSEAINTTHGGANGVRTIFSFGADTVASANSYLVQEVSISDKSYVKVSAINYDANYYKDDLLAVPTPEDVL